MSKLTESQIEVLKQVVSYINTSPINSLRDKLKREFPDVFPKTIQKYIEEVGATCWGYPVKYNDEFVFVRMPNANHEWTFAAFKWTKEFCDTVNDDADDSDLRVAAYPIHGVCAARAINRAVESGIIDSDCEYQVIKYSLR
jgi:hypothetical protein